MSGKYGQNSFSAVGFLFSDSLLARPAINNPGKPMNEIQSSPLQKASNADKVKLPYFDYLLARLKEGNESVEKSFGRHVHWGYWERPEPAVLSTVDFA